MFCFYAAVMRRGYLSVTSAMEMSPWLERLELVVEGDLGEKKKKSD